MAAVFQAVVLSLLVLFQITTRVSTKSSHAKAKVTCPSGWQTYGDDCYYFEGTTTTMTWHEAQAKCVEQGANNGLTTYLASIHSAGEDYFITGWNGWTSQILHIGFQQTAINSSEFRWVDNTPTDYAVWYPGQPDLGDELQCVYIDGGNGYAWFDASCQRAVDSNYVCKTGPEIATTTTFTPETRCPPGWAFFKEFCYFFSTDQQSRTFAMAQLACEQQGTRDYVTGSNLVSIHNVDEDIFINSYYQQLYNTPVWTGLQQTTVGVNDFSWTDGTPFDYTGWYSTQPDNFTGSQLVCVYMLKQSIPLTDWYDGPCQNAYNYFVCKANNVQLSTTTTRRPLTTTATTTTMVTTAASTNDVTSSTEDTTDSTDDITDSTDDVTDPTDEVTDPTGEVTDPTDDEVTDPTDDEVTDPTDDVTDPTGDVTLPPSSEASPSSTDVVNDATSATVTIAPSMPIAETTATTQPQTTTSTPSPTTAATTTSPSPTTAATTTSPSSTTATSSSASSPTTPSTPPPPTTPTTPPPPTGLTGGQIAGIVVGVALGVGVLTFGVVRWRRNSSKSKAPAAGNSENGAAGRTFNDAGPLDDVSVSTTNNGKTQLDSPTSPDVSNNPGSDQTADTEGVEIISVL